MNKRIKLLAEQAGAVYSNDHAVSLLDDEIEKFAELIVRECANKVDSNLRDWLQDSNGTMGDKIKEHFGVEE